MIAFENVSKQFDGRNVLDRMTLDMADRGVTCLLGVSGCGKSTAMRIAAGLSRADEGQVFIPRGECGVVFQDTRLLPWLSTAENLNLALPPKLRTSEGAEMRASALEAVALDPGAVSQLFPHELSGGMAQRVGIARALLRRPRYLMMDEPFAALDAMTRNDLQIMLKELVTSTGARCLFVTHDIEESFSLAERILVMKDGSINVTFSRRDFDNWSKRELVLDQILGLLGKYRS